jgi:hypothetical protein
VETGGGRTGNRRESYLAEQFDIDDLTAPGLCTTVVEKCLFSVCGARFGGDEIPFLASVAKGTMREVSYRDQDLSKRQLLMLCKALQTSTHLTHLDLTGNKLEGVELQLVEVVQQCEPLTQLVICGITLEVMVLTGEARQTDSAGKKRSPRIDFSEQIHARGAQYIDSDRLQVGFFVAELALRNNVSKTIKLNDCELFFPEMRKCHGKLDFYASSHMRLDDCIILTKMAKMAKKISEIDLSNNATGSGLGAVMGSYIPSALRLTTLNLSSNNLGGEGALGLAEGLAVAKTIATLNLSNNGLCNVEAPPERTKGAAAHLTAIRSFHDADEEKATVRNLTGFTALAAAIRKTNLTDLDLRENALMDSGAELIAEWVLAPNREVSMDLRSNKIGLSGGRAIYAALVSCEAAREERRVVAQQKAARDALKSLHGDSKLEGEDPAAVAAAQLKALEAALEAGDEVDPFDQKKTPEIVEPLGEGFFRAISGIPLTKLRGGKVTSLVIKGREDCGVAINQFEDCGVAILTSMLEQFPGTVDTIILKGNLLSEAAKRLLGDVLFRDASAVHTYVSNTLSLNPASVGANLTRLDRGDASIAIALLPINMSMNTLVVGERDVEEEVKLHIARALVRRSVLLHEQLETERLEQERLQRDQEELAAAQEAQAREEARQRVLAAKTAARTGEKVNANDESGNEGNQGKDKKDGKKDNKGSKKHKNLATNFGLVSFVFGKWNLNSMSSTVDFADENLSIGDMSLICAALQCMRVLSVVRSVNNRYIAITCAFNRRSWF